MKPTKPAEKQTKQVWNSLRYRTKRNSLKREGLFKDYKSFKKWYLSQYEKPPICHYCDIPEAQFEKVWGIFYKTRGRRLEIDRKDNVIGYTLENCVLACSVCNNAKSNKFEYQEFKKVGNVIKKIWEKRLAPKTLS